jgi:Tol biopolymer transport system component
VQAGFRRASHATWSGDGRRLALSGCREESEDSCDWWVTPVDGSNATATGAAKLLRESHIAGALPDLWTESEIVFAGRTGEKTRLWSLGISTQNWQAAGKPRRVTTGDRDERAPAAGADGSIIFTSRTENVDVWILPLDANSGKTTGALTRVTSDAAIDQRPSLSSDGKRVAWETSRGGNFEVWVKDLVSGEERGLTNGPLREHMPALSRDGSRLVYDSHDGETVTVLESAFGGGVPVQVWQENVGQGSFQWTTNGDSVLYFHREPPGTVGLMNLKSKKRTVLLRHPKFNLSLADARLSPDGRAIAFPVPFAPHRSRLAVARLQGKVIEEERDWAYVTPEAHNAFQPEWSPDGRRLYFLSDQNGRLAVWTLALSRELRPQGDPQAVLDLPGRGRSIAEMRPRDIGLSVASDKLALGVAEYSGGLWSAPNPAP